MPPSTSSIALPSRAATCSTFAGEDAMNGWPPHPGFTVITRIRSAYAATPDAAAGGVPGFSATPARQPASWMAPIVRCACGSASRWKVMQSAPAFANSTTWRAGLAIIRCTSSTAPASWARSAIEPATSGPIVIGGTKLPSMTSTWITRAPAARTSLTCSPRRAKSADRIDGATRRPLNASRFAIKISDVAQHRVAAMLADHVLCGAHPGDRLVLAAARTLRDQLVAEQAVHAAKAARQLRRAQPRLTAAGTGRALEGGLAHLPDRPHSSRRLSVGKLRSRVAAQILGRSHLPPAGGFKAFDPKDAGLAAEEEGAIPRLDHARRGVALAEACFCYSQPHAARKIQVRADLGMERPDGAFQLDRRARGVEPALGGIDLLRVGGPLLDLLCRRQAAPVEPLERRRGELDGERRKPLAQRRAIVAGLDRRRLGQRDWARVEPRGDARDAHPGPLIARHDRPLDRRGSAPARQQRRVDIPELELREQRLANDLPECAHEPGVGRCGGERRAGAVVVDIRRLMDLESEVPRHDRRRRRAEAPASALRAVGWRHHQGGTKAALVKAAQDCGREVRRAQVGDPHLFGVGFVVGLWIRRRIRLALAKRPHRALALLAHGAVEN